MNQQEITVLKNQVWEDWIAGDATEPSTIQLLDMALCRLAVLEAAVAFKGWDEVPETKGERDFIEIDVRRSGGLIDQIVYCKSAKLFMQSPSTSHFILEIGEMLNAGFTGWRYPVGDLG